MIDTHAHIDGEEFSNDLEEVLARAKDSGVEKVFVPAISLASCKTTINVCKKYPDYLFPMLGLHPEEVSADYREQLKRIRAFIDESIAEGNRLVAIGEIGLDYYWSREYEKEQLEAFREQIEWSIALHLPLMLHCRKAQGEMLHLLKEYKSKLVGGVFHCFTGNEHEARELLQFDNFVLGIGGVLTFKNSSLPTTLAAAVPLDRIVLETDAPYMAPVPMRGKRNESAFVRFVLEKLAEAYALDRSTIEQTTNETVYRVFGI